MRLSMSLVYAAMQMAFNGSMSMGSCAMWATPKQNPKRQKTASKEHYRWVLLCFDVQEDTDPCGRTNKPKANDRSHLGDLQTLQVQIARLKIIQCEDKYGELSVMVWMCKTYGEHSLFSRPKRFGGRSHTLKAHWDSLEESKVRNHVIET